MILHKSPRLNLEKRTVMKLDKKSLDLLNEYLKIEAYYKYALREMSARLENLDDYCEMNYAHNPIHHMESRLKTPESIIQKIQVRGFEFSMESLVENIYDIAGIRVVCCYIFDIYKLLELLEGQSNLKIKIKKDYIKNPKETGYRSLHVILEMQITIGNIDRWVPVEIQFRTIAMDMWASLEHELRYKSDNKFSIEDTNALKKYSDDLHEIDKSMENIYINNNSN